MESLSTNSVHAGTFSQHHRVPPKRRAVEKKRQELRCLRVDGWVGSRARCLTPVRFFWYPVVGPDRESFNDWATVRP